VPSPLRADTLAELYRLAAEKFGPSPAFARKGPSGQFETTSYHEIYALGLDLATALIDLGVAQREHVGLLADNRLEWIIADYGILLAGAADVPRGTDITGQEITYILSHAGARMVFVENAATLAKLQRCLPELRGIEKIILMDPSAEAPRGVLKLEDLLRRGSGLRASGDRRAERRMEEVHPGDLFTIIYTSGTTGVPKGVPLTHANMMSQIRNLPFDLGVGLRALSILPIWHSYERVFEMVSISWGVCTYYTGLRHIAEDLKVARPHVMASAPRLWESLYQKILANVNRATPLRRALFHAAYGSTRAVKRAMRFFLGQQLDLHGRPPLETARLAVTHMAAWLACIIPHLVLDSLVLAKLRDIVGGHFRGTISGGGALQPHVDEFFNFIGIPVLEGYGLTETSPVLAVRTWENLVIGTVGPAFPETRVRIVDLNTGQTLYPDPARRDGGRGLRGEIHVAGPQVMRGYHNNPEATARVLREGWLNTGDIGLVTFNDCLKILGRSKETIVLLSGENVEPTPIESRLVESPLIDQCMVVGQDQKYLGALIVPSFEGFHAAGEPAADPETLGRSLRARVLLEGEIRRLVGPDTGFKPFERIAAWAFAPKAFAPGDELTNTFKLKRHVIADRYADLIATMFAPK